MRRAPSRFVMVGVGAVLALGGCSSGGDSSSQPRDVPRNAPQTTTTGAPARIDLSQPIPGGSLHGTPRPPLENTGDDYVAIFESLTANFRWLTENPDLGVIEELFVPGTPPHDARVDAYGYLVDNEYRWADEGYQLISVEILDARSEAVSLRVVERLDFELLVDAEGSQVGETRIRGANETVNVLLVPDASGRWRIADTTSEESTVVEV